MVTSDASTAVKGNPGHLLIDDISSEAVNQVVESTRHTIFERFPAKIPLELQQLIAGAEYTARLRSAIKVSATATSGLLGSNDLAELLRSLPVDKLQEGPESEATLHIKESLKHPSCWIHQLHTQAACWIQVDTFT